MNLKLNNEQQISTCAAGEGGGTEGGGGGGGGPVPVARTAIKEERRRTGRYIAILVGISLLFLALYQAWVRRIPLVASLVVPALIMFLYIAWVLYTASRDKRNRARDLEQAMNENPSLSTLEVDERSLDVDKVDVDIHLNNSAPAPALTERCASVRRLALPDNSVTNVSLELRYSHDTNLNEASASQRLKPNLYIKPIILVNDQPCAESAERLEANNNFTVAGDDFGGCDCTCTHDHKHRRLKAYTPTNAVFRRSYSIA